MRVVKVKSVHGNLGYDSLKIDLIRVIFLPFQALCVKPRGTKGGKILSGLFFHNVQSHTNF